MSKRKLGSLLVLAGVLLPFTAFLSISIGNRKAVQTRPEGVVTKKDVLLYEKALEGAAPVEDPFDKNVDKSHYPKEFGDKVY